MTSYVIAGDSTDFGNTYTQSGDAQLDNVTVAGLRINAKGNFKRVRTTRADWMPPTSTAQMLDQAYSAVNGYDVTVQIPNGPNLWTAGAPINWSFARTSPYTFYNGPMQVNMGIEPFVWSVGGTRGGPATNDVWIGGRSDSSSSNIASRAILEFGGMLGRAVPIPSAANSFNVTDQAGTDTDITGGPSTGAGVGGGINFWTSNPGASSATPNSGLLRWKVNGAGHFVAGLDNTYDIGAAGATRPRRVYAGTDFVGTIGATTPASGTFTTLTTTGGGASTVTAGGFISGSTTFTSNGGCTEGTLVGGSTAGKFTTSGSTSCTVIVTMGGGVTATNGWSCTAIDLTTAIDVTNPHQTASSTTTATFATGTIVAGDVIQFSCIGY